MPTCLMALGNNEIRACRRDLRCLGTAGCGDPNSNVTGMRVCNNPLRWYPEMKGQIGWRCYHHRCKLGYQIRVKGGLWDVIPVLWGKRQHLQCSTGGLCVCCRERWWFTEHKKIRVDHAAGLALYRCQIGSNRFWRAIGKTKAARTPSIADSRNKFRRGDAASHRGLNDRNGRRDKACHGVRVCRHCWMGRRWQNCRYGQSAGPTAPVVRPVTTSRHAVSG